MPPLTVSVAEYAFPAVASGRVSGLTVNGAASIVRLNVLVTFVELASLTRTLNWKIPLPVGVPLIVPLDASNLNPAGSEPELMDHA